MKPATKHLLPIFILLLSALFIVGVNASKQQEQVKRKGLEIPKIISKVHSIEIVSTEIKGEDESTAFVAIKIKNNTNKLVIAVGVEVSDGVDSVGTVVNGFHEGDEPPSVVIEPFGSITVNFPLSNLKQVKPGNPIKIGGVMFADGTEQGDRDTLDTMRGQKEHYKSKPKKVGDNQQ